MSKNYSNYRRNGCLMEAHPSAAPSIDATSASASGLPSRVDLRGMCSPVEDQGDVGSCAANAAVGALEYHQRLTKQPMIDLSRLYVYYNARRMAGKQADDCGTLIPHVMASVMAFGACPEQMWPYLEAMWPTEPTQVCYQAAQNFGGVSFARAALGTPCKAAVASGLPVVFGTFLPDHMLHVEGARTGRIQRPTEGWPGQGSGGHAMLIVGYDDASQAWLVRNSWGPGYGDGGHVWIDYQVMEAYSPPTEFWTIGAIAGRPGINLIGPSAQQSVAAIRQSAPATLTDALGHMRHVLGKDLNLNLDATRKGIRDRLRGPGAGGGY